MATPRLITLSDGVAEATSLRSSAAASPPMTSSARPGARLCSAPAAIRRARGPFDLAKNLLVPWSNRISGGGFHFDGRFHPLAPNLPGEPFPIHGNGFSSRWSVEQRDRGRAELSLRSDGPGPFRYEAMRDLFADAGALTMRLSRPQSRHRAAAFRPRLSPLDRADARGTLLKQKRSGS